MELRIKEVAKLRGFTLQELSSGLGITYQGFNQKLLRSPNIVFIQNVADILEVSVFELIASDDNTYHSYDENNNWMGVLKK